MDSNTKLYVVERIMTDGTQHAESNMEVCMNGSGSSAQITFRSVGKGEQLLKLRTLGMTEAEAENVIIENFLS